MSSTDLLDGYKAIQLPDLSLNRRKNSNTHTLIHQTALDEDLRMRVSDNATLDALILVAYASVLGMYCGSTDIIISLEGSNDASVPFRLQWDETTTWRGSLEFADAALKQMKQQSTSTFISTFHRDSELVPGQYLSVATFRDSSRATSHISVTSPLFLQQPLLYHEGDGLLDLHSPPHLFCDSTASMLLRQLVAVVSQAYTNLEQRISAPLHMHDKLASVVQALPEHERSHVYSHIPSARFATDFILSPLTSNPSATAVEWFPSLSPHAMMLRHPERMSYKDLHHTANRFAHFLLTKGISPEDRVAVCMNRDLMYHWALFGIMRAGGCYVPIDPELPTERKLFIASNSCAKFVIVSLQLDEHNIFGDLSIDIGDKSIQETIYSMSDAEVEDGSVLPGNVAYMLYTSGTTGNPKGCLITHNNLTEAILSLSSFPVDVKMTDIREGRYLATASIAFDVHLAEVFVALALGMTLVSVKRGELLENVPLYISLLEITHVALVPSLIDATMCAVEDDRKREDMKLRYISSGGEKISDSILDKWADHPLVKLANFYGRVVPRNLQGYNELTDSTSPSEVSIGCCARFVDGNTPRENIGRPFPNVSSYVVDDNLNVLPRGVMGELVVAGPLVGRGYHELPHLTAKSFMEWPRPGSWSYRTGDLVRMLPDDTLHIIGRVDTQIKLRGVRIEAEGISAVFSRAALSQLGLRLDAGTVLAAHPSIGNGTIPQLVTFVAWGTPVSLTLRRTTKPHVVSFENNVLQDLRAISERELASYMRPAHIVRLSWLPLSPTGKTDNKVLSGIFMETDLLQLIGTTTSNTQAAGDSTLTSVQRHFVSLVESHVKISPIDPRTNLFAYGMDSLSLVALATDIRQTFGVSVSVADIMKAASIKSVGDLIQTQSQPPDLPSLDVLRSFSEEWFQIVGQNFPYKQIERVFPSFPLQEGVLYHSDGHQASCVQHVVMKLSNQITLLQVRDAWEVTMNKLDILRTVFYFGRELVQVILTPSVSQLPWVEERVPFTDANSFYAFFYAEVAPSLAKQINSTVSKSPPFRLILFSTPGDRVHWLTLSIHHALFDGVSLPLILKFVEEELLAQPHPVTCSPESLLGYMHSGKVDAGRQFWSTMFSDFDRPRNRAPSILSANQIRRSSISLTTSLTTLGELLAPHQVTLQSALTCAFALSLGKYIQHTDDVTFVVVRAGRLLPVDGAEHAIYPTLNVLPTRIRFDTKDYLQSVQANISAAAAFEHFPLSQVQQWLPPGITPFDALFAVTVKDDTQYEVWDILRSELSEPDFPLSVEILIDKGNDSLVIQAAYCDSEYLTTGVGNIIRRFEAILLDILDKEKAASLPLEVVRYTNLASSAPMPQPQDDPGVVFGEKKSLDVDGLALLKEVISTFFGFSSEQLHASTSLISLGLDSIRSVGLSRLLRQHGYPVKAADIMGNLTIQKLSALCARPRDYSAQTEIDQAALSLQKQRETIKAGFDSATCKLSLDDEVEIFPTTALQAGMISQTIASAGNLYFHSFLLDLNSDTDLVLLRSAWERTVRDLDILRTTFHYVAELGTWVQARHSIITLNWQEHPSTPSMSIQRTIDEIFSRLKPVNESALFIPQIYLRTLRSDADSLHLLLFMHHALYDGFSIPILLSHVERIYQQQEIASPVQFFDFIPRMLLQQDSATAYWVDRLQNYRPGTLPRHISRSPKVVIASRLVSIEQESLTRLVRDGSVALQCLVQAAWVKYLSSLLSSNDIVFGHVVSGRSFDDSENVVGPVLNTIPCRVQLLPDMSNRELLQSIHDINISALPWQHVSLRAVQSEMKLHGLLSSLLLFQPRRPNVSSRLWTLREQEDFETQIQYPLNIEFHEMDNGILVKMACQTEILDAEAINSALFDIEVLMSEMVDHLDHPISTLAPSGPSTQPANFSMSNSQLVDAPHVPLELLAILASVAHCSVDDISPSQSLVAIGVDSITAIGVSAKCRKAGLMISVADIVSSFTIGELAEKATTGDQIAAAPQRTTISLQIPPEECQAIFERFPEKYRSKIASVSAATEGMKWLIAAWQRSFGQRFHHVFAYKLSPGVNIQQLRSAWKSLIDYHPILRSTFASAPGHDDPRMITFLPNSTEVDLDEEFVDHILDSPALSERMKAVVMSPLPISAAQAKGLILTSSSTSNRYLLIRMHHFQYDAFSLHLVLEDLACLYLGLLPRNTSDAYAFLAAFSPSLIRLSEQKAYWQSAMPIPFLPVYLPPQVPEKGQLSSVERTLVTITSAISGAAELKKQAQEINLPLHCVLLACWASLQAHYSSSDHATFGLWHAGRTSSISNILNLAIPCMNVLPIYIPMSNNLVEVARSVQRGLHRRTPVIQQSNLLDVDKWVTGGKCLPLTNVFVNVFERAKGTVAQVSELFEFVEINHSIPTEPLVYEESEVIDTLPITKILQDDVMVDIVINEELDTITMSIESAQTIMDNARAKEMIDEWATRVQLCLSSVA